MDDELLVELSGRECAILTESREGNLSLRYQDNYPGNATPISLSMPVGPLKYPKKIVLPFLQGLMPDNENALKAISRKYEVSGNNPFRILKHIGHEVAGALEFKTAKGHVDRLDRKSRKLDSLEIEEILTRKISEYEDGIYGLGYEEALSLAGAQAKVALHRSPGGEWFEPHGENISTHIIKPVPDRWKNLDVVEHQTMLAAQKLGLKVAKSEIASFGSMQAFVTERYDRVMDANGQLKRVHQEDFCQALSVTPSKKYQRNDGGPGVGEIAKLLPEIISPADRTKLAKEFFKGLSFNVLSKCTDAHAKNYSMLLAGQSVELAPLYDLSSTVLYSLPMKSAMSINSKYRFEDISTKDLLIEANRLGVDLDWAQDWLNEMNLNLLSAFSEAGSDIRNTAQSKLVHQTTFALVDALSSVGAK
jgi:serine/threonine-protein kinase HipA